MLKWALALSVALCTAQQAAAQSVEYHVIAGRMSAAGVIDKLSIKTVNGYQRGWLTVIYTTESHDIDGETIAFLSSLQEADCVQDRVRNLAVVSRDADFKVISYKQTPGDWKFVEPNTNNADIRDALCHPETLTADSILPQTSLRDIRASLWAWQAQHAADKQ